MAEKYLKIIILSAILLIAGFFRFYQLADVPPGLYPDVAINGNDALAANYAGDYKVFYPENNGREGIFINLIAYSFKIFGPSIWAIKFVAVLFGFLTILGLYLFANELFKNWQIAALSSFLMSISFWHVNFSRIGFRAIMVPFVLIFLMYFLLKAFRTRHFFWFGLAGIFFALGFYTYISYRVVPLIVAVFIIYEFLRDWRNIKTADSATADVNKRRLLKIKNILINRGWWKFVVIFTLFFIIIIYPLFNYFKNNPQDFMGRAGQVSVFSADNPLKEIIISGVKTIGMFNVWGDCNFRHNFGCKPQLLWPVGILFLLGLYFVSKQFYQKVKNKNRLDAESEVILYTMWSVMLLPAILSTEGLPHALRAIGAIPATFIFAGIGAYYTLESLKNLFLKQKKLKLLYFAVTFILFGALILAQFNKYFISWASHPETAGAFAKNYVELGRYLNTLPINTKKIVIVNEAGVLVKGIPMPAQTVMFITAAEDKIDLPTNKNIIYILPEQIENYLQICDSRESVVITSLSPGPELLEKLQKIKPGCKLMKENGIWTLQKNKYSDIR